MALVIDLSFMLPLLDLISSSSSAGLTKWNTLSSSNRAFPISEKQHFFNFLVITLLLIYSCTPLQNVFRWWKMGGCLSSEFECRQNIQAEMLNNQQFWNAHKKAEDKSAYYFSIISKCAKTRCISMLNESREADKSHGEKKQRDALYSQVHIWSVWAWIQQV